MPRKSPDNIQEYRFTTGTWERQFIKETKEDIEKGVQVAALTAIALPASIAVGAGAVGLGVGVFGYYLYQGLANFTNPLSTLVDDKVGDLFLWLGLVKPPKPYKSRKDYFRHSKRGQEQPDYAYTEQETGAMYGGGSSRQNPYDGDNNGQASGSSRRDGSGSNRY